MTSRRVLYALAVALALPGAALAAGCGSGSSSTSTAAGGAPAAGGGGGGAGITGSGSTFAQPIYAEWANEDGDQLNYQPVGSGQGISDFTAGNVNFGATDVPMKDEEIAAAKAKGEPVHIPTVLGAITVSYKLGGVDSGLKLDGPTLASIFLGKITKWDDPAIAGLNPDVKLPATDITVEHRSDASGTTAQFTAYLAGISPEWKSGPGADKTVDWPVGTGSQGNNGVASAVQSTDGAIGYVELAYALQNNFTTAAVKDKAGEFVAPTIESTTAAGDGLKVPADLRFSPVDAPGKGAYPIVSGTFILVYQDLCKAGASPDAAKATVKFLDFALGAGQQSAAKIQYAPLAPDLLAKTKAKVASLQCNGQPISAG